MHTLLVTGGVGFIGSTFAKLALNLGHSVTILDNLSTGSRENSYELERLGATIVIGDLRDLDLVNSLLKGVNAVIHLGAQISVPVSVKNPSETEEINIMGTQNVIDSCVVATFCRSFSLVQFDCRGPLPSTHRPWKHPVLPP